MYLKSWKWAYFTILASDKTGEVTQPNESMEKFLYILEALIFLFQISLSHRINIRFLQFPF